MPFPLLIPLLAGGASSILGGILGNRKAARTGTQQSQFSQTSTPTFSPEFQELRDMQLQQILNRLRSSADLSGFKAQGLQEINRGAGLTQQALENRLAGQGLLGSPIAGNALTNLELSRGGQQSQFLSGIPLLQRQMQGEDLQQALNLLSLGRGTTTTGTSSGQQVLPGSAAGAGFSDLGNLLGFLLGMGVFGKAGGGLGGPGPGAGFGG